MRTAFRTGLELDFTPLERLGFSASLGYKGLLSGHRPGLDAGFKADPAYHFRAVRKDEGRDFVTYGIGVEVALHDNVRFSGGFSGEQSDRSRSCQGYVGIQVDW